MSESWVVEKHCEAGGATSDIVVAMVLVLLLLPIVVVLGCCLAWFSEKHCLFIAMSEGSLSHALISDLLPVGVVVVNIVVVVVVGVVVVDAVVVPVVVGVGVCAIRPLLLSFSLSSDASSSFVSCWYISSTIGFHNRTRALMNQFETYGHKHTFTILNVSIVKALNLYNSAI